MHIHQEILETVRQITAGKPDAIFGVEEIVQRLAHLNESSVRTHVSSRCCVNAPQNHPHKWDYFRRVGWGKYQLMPAHRRSPRKLKTNSGAPVTKTAKTGARPSNRAARNSRSLREILHAAVHLDNETYVGECLELAVVTQGSSLDEVTENLRQAIALHLEDEDMEALGFRENPRLQVIYDVPVSS